MLANALFYVALLSIAAMTFLSAGLTMTRVSATRMAETYLAVGYQRGIASLERSIAANVQSGGLLNPLPTFTPLPPACADGGVPCLYETSATISLSSGAITSTACDSSQSNCAANEQANAYISESRIPARITVVVTTSRDGAQLATRSSDVILRTIATPPYVVAAGARDGSLDAIASSRAAGDDGGAPPATPNPCSSASPGTADDTAIRVAYQNAATNACTDGSQWRSSGYTVNSASASGWSP